MDITVKEVTTKKDLRRWIEFPNLLYNDNKYYVPFLANDEAETFSDKKILHMPFAKPNFF